MVALAMLIGLVVVGVLAAWRGADSRTGDDWRRPTTPYAGIGGPLSARLFR